jgi:hypothetical protein
MTATIQATKCGRIVSPVCQKRTFRKPAETLGLITGQVKIRVVGKPNVPRGSSSVQARLRRTIWRFTVSEACPDTVLTL